MEHIGKLIVRDGQLVSRSSAETAISETCSVVELLRQEGVPEWEIALAQLAQDKRHDLPEEMFRWWREKLSQHRDSEIRQAIVLWSGEFFPSVDDVIKSIVRMRERRAEEKSGQDQATVKTEREKIEQFMREHDGKTPAQVFCEENRALVNHLDMKLNSQVRSVRPRGDVVSLSQANALRTAGVKSGTNGEAVQVQQSVEPGAQEVAPQAGTEREGNQAEQPGQAS